jgi:polyphosphate kinase 2 (PPK2 family)
MGSGSGESKVKIKIFTNEKEKKKTFRLNFPFEFFVIKFDGESFCLKIFLKIPRKIPLRRMKSCKHLPKKTYKNIQKIKANVYGMYIHKK